MKILVLTNLYPPDVIGGYELGCKQAVDALMVRGHEVRVLTTAPRTPAPPVSHVDRSWQLGEIWNAYLFDHSSPITARLLQAQANLVNAVNVHALVEAAEAFRPDVAYLWNLVGVGGVAIVAAVQHLGIPWVWHLMDEVPTELCRIAGQNVGPLLREIDRQLDGRFLACSRQLVDEIEAGGISVADRAELVPNWIVGPNPDPRTRSYRPGLGDPLRIMTAGQINRSKGIDILIDAARLVRDAGRDDFRVDLFGSTDDPYFLALTRHRGLERHVHFRGPRPQAELGALYADHDLFAFPTWAREPFGFAPLEAARRGCVPLVSRACGYAEWMVSGVHALKTDRSAGAFADAILGVLEGSTDLAPIARRASSVVGRDFHIDAQVPKIERALGEMAARPRKRSGGAGEAYRLALLAEKLTRVMVAKVVEAA